MKENKAPWYYLLLLVLAGESVFILPFVLARVFRPTVLDAFSLNNVELGLCFSVYGTVALIAYILGGPIADKFSPRKLIAVSLWTTALGGFLYATFPDFKTLKILYGYWGFTTIFLFWAPMIKAARVWGGNNNQGKAYGFLDGGRGLVGALFGTMGVLIFSLFITSEIASASIEESQLAFKYVIWVASVMIIVVGVLVWNFMKLDDEVEQNIVIEKISVNQILEVLKLPAVWLLMIIILCAYVGYKATDVLSLYAKDVMLYNQVESAKVGTFLLFIRPIVGVIIGILADRTQTAYWLLISFIITVIGALFFATGLVPQYSIFLFFFSILTVSTGVYATRSLYFAVMKQGRIPLVLTGTAVGLISLVGYTPDIFAGPAMGYLLDSNPGIVGHQHVFWMLGGFSLIGTIAAGIYYGLYRKKEIEFN